MVEKMGEGMRVKLHSLARSRSLSVALNHVNQLVHANVVPEQHVHVVQLILGQDLPH